MLDETIYGSYIFLIMSKKNYKNTQFEVGETKIGVVLSLPFENAHVHAKTL